MKSFGIDLAEGTTVHNMVIGAGAAFPANPDPGEMFHKTGTNAGLYWYNDTGQWTILNAVNSVAGRTGNVTLTTTDVQGLATVASTGSYNDLFDKPQGLVNYTPVNKAGDVMTGNLGLPAAPGSGLTVQSQYGWRDLTGEVIPRSGASNQPVLKAFRGNVREYTYQAGDTGDCRYHVPHDYVPGTDLFIHVHWSHNGTAISGTMDFQFEITYASGHQTGTFIAPIVVHATASNLAISNAPQYQHRVTEIQITGATTTASTIARSAIEVDGMFLVNFTANTIPSISGSSVANLPYIMTVDLHYQSTSVGTLNKAPNFYG